MVFNVAWRITQLIDDSEERLQSANELYTHDSLSVSLRHDVILRSGVWLAIKNNKWTVVVRESTWIVDSTLHTAAVVFALASALEEPLFSSPPQYRHVSVFYQLRQGRCGLPSSVCNLRR